MVKTLQKIGNSQGLIIDKAILELLDAKKGTKFEIKLQNGGILLKPLLMEKIYKRVSKKHRKSLNKLGE